MAAPGAAPGSPAGCPPVARTSGSGATYFPQTGHTIAPHFAAYWAAHGGLAIFGYPISEAFTAPAADGGVYEMQWFERARFEWHPDAPGDGVLLARLGADPAARLGAGPAARLAGAVWVPETGHNLVTFATWWAQHGGVPVFGYPLSEEHAEVNPTDGQTYTVQYFERNRLEAHPAAGGGPPAVTLGLLGAESLRQASCLP